MAILFPITGHSRVENLKNYDPTNSVQTKSRVATMLLTRTAAQIPHQEPEIPRNIDRTDNEIIVKIEADDIAKKLLENKLAISLCQNLSYYSTITSNNLEISNDGHGNCPCPLLPAR